MLSNTLLAFLFLFIIFPQNPLLTSSLNKDNVCSFMTQINKADKNGK